MTIKEDAGEILLLIYNDFIDNNNSITPKSVLDITKWEGHRIDLAIKYLRDIGAVEFIFTMGNVDGVQNFIIRGLLPVGINIIENESKFEDTFGFNVKLPFVNFSWTRKKN